MRTISSELGCGSAGAARDADETDLVLALEPVLPLLLLLVMVVLLRLAEETAGLSKIADLPLFVEFVEDDFLVILLLACRVPLAILTACLLAAEATAIAILKRQQSR